MFLHIHLSKISLWTMLIPPLYFLSQGTSSRARNVPEVTGRARAGVVTMPASFLLGWGCSSVVRHPTRLPYAAPAGPYVRRPRP